MAQKGLPSAGENVATARCQRGVERLEKIASIISLLLPSDFLLVFPVDWIQPEGGKTKQGREAASWVTGQGEKVQKMDVGHIRRWCGRRRGQFTPVAPEYSGKSEKSSRTQHPARARCCPRGCETVLKQITNTLHHCPSTQITPALASNSSNLELSELGGFYYQSQILAVLPWVRIMLSCPFNIMFIHVTYFGQVNVSRTGKLMGAK